MEESVRNVDQAARDLSRVIEGQVRFGRHDRMLYATDASLYQVEPLGVVVPTSVADAERAIAYCIENGLPILPRGGGTSLAGQCVNRAVVIDLSVNCRAVGEVDETRRRVRVEPGVTLDELNEELARRRHQLFFAPDVATSRHANIGGMIGNNSAGARSVLYGRTLEHVAGVDVALATPDRRLDRVTLEESAALRDEHVRALTERVIEVVRRYEAQIRERFPRTKRRSSGYNLDSILEQIERPGDPLENVNLASLICGSEGTLAVTLGAELNLEPTPIARALAIISFDSLRSAIEMVNPVLETGPSAVELLDDLVLSLARRNATHSGAVDLLPRFAGEPDPAAALYVEYFAFQDARELDERFDALRRLVAGRPIATFLSPRDMQQAWSLRKAAEPLLHGLPGLRKPITFVEDTAVDPQRLPEFVERFRAIVEARGTRAAYFAHASVGCLHIRPMLDPHDPADRDLLRAIAVDVADLVREFGGALSGEHGDGRVRGPLLEKMFGPELMRAFREIKSIFDPHNLLNPGNIVDPGPVEAITARLRVLPEAAPIVVPAVDTYFDYRDQHGFDGAVEMCNGAGVCRKKQGGTMCPSYMATLDERHSTRGRGNALRLAITGQFGTLGVADWRDEETHKTLDLCLSCKACKSECPSNVDIARLKSEYLAQGYRNGGRAPLRDRLFANVRRLNAAASVAPGLANALQRARPVRSALNRVLGLAPRRSLPPFARSLSAQSRRAQHLHPEAERGAVALFVDCFTGFGESDIGLAAIDALGACGWRVSLLDAGCCQRPAISLGLLDRAVSRSERTLRMLAEAAHDESIAAILFLEPSCLSAVKDDLLALKGATSIDVRRRIAQKSMLVEELLAQTLGPEVIAPDGPPVLFHGHCHQKALWGVDSSANMLRRLVGDRLTILDSGCCGMAGAFGMTADHFDLSMKIGELTLLPAVRAASEEAIILATGASCRRQIHDGADRRALHPMELAACILRHQGRETNQ